MAKRIIECQVNDEYVLGSGVVVGAAGSHDDVVLRLAFGEMWVGRNIYATFNDANGENPVHSMLMASMLVPGEVMTYDVTIPAEAKRYAGKMMLTLTGYSIVDGVQEDMATNTTTAYFRVLPSDFSPLDDGTITPTLAQQVQDEMREYGEAVEEQLATILDVATAEGERKDAEDKRKAAEETRGAAETERIDAENKRKAAEDVRADAEKGRKAAETLRVETDKTRNDFLGDLKTAVGNILGIQEMILNGDADLVAREEVIKAINETLLIADDLETDDPYKALSAAQGVVLKSLADSATKTVSGWYNGTNTTTTTLTFSFVPKVILIAEKSHFFEIGSLVSGYGMARRGCAVLFPEKSVLFHQFHGITSETDTSVMNGMSVDVGKITLNGESVTIDRGGCLNSFNVQSTVGTNSDNAVTAKEKDGYGYWYFAIG